jgi:hypothetical protein
MRTHSKMHSRSHTHMKTLHMQTPSESAIMNTNIKSALTTYSFKAMTGAKTQAKTGTKMVEETTSTPDFSNVVFQSWGNYFSFISGYEPTKDNIEFYINRSYAELQKIPHNPLDKDEFGWVDIPSKFSFWLILYKEKFYMLNCRRLITIRIVDEFALSDVAEAYIDVKSVKHAGVEALEKFAEGFCLKIKLKSNPLFKNDILIICMENEELRDLWVKSFSMVIYFYNSNFSNSTFP